MGETNQTISSRSDFPKSKKGLYNLWHSELEAGNKAKKRWVKAGKQTNARFLAETDKDSMNDNYKTLNLYHSNVETLISLLFGNAPRVDLDRTNHDANDDAARVAAEMMERMLNVEFEDPGTTTADDLQQALQDRLIPGMGTVRVRYENDIEETKVEALFGDDGEEVAPAFTEENLLSETAPTEYVPWDSLTWSPCKVWADLRWISFEVKITVDEATERWGKKIANKLPTTKDKTSDNADVEEEEEEAEDAWQRITLEEIWSKEDRKVYWYCDGYPAILQVENDPLEVQGFWPCPRPMMANVTTTALMPVPDFKFAEDLYNSIDELTTRIQLLSDSLRVVGFYPEDQNEIAGVLNSALENVMIPVPNWNEFSEKGGMEGSVSWFPIEHIAKVMSELTEKRAVDIALLNQTIGMSDVMRGASSGGVKSAGEKQLEAKFGSVRVQALQDEFAKFASDLMRIKAEIISIHFDDETIVGQSGMMHSMDTELLPQALELIRDPAEFAWRVQIKPESVAMVDYAALKQERVEYIESMSLFMQSATGLAQMFPESVPTLLEMLKWGMAGFKGSSSIEGVLDKAIEQLNQQQKEGGEEDDPEAKKAADDAAADQAKHMAKMEQIEAEKASKLEVISAELAADMQKMQNLAQLDVQEADQKHQMELKEIQTEATAALQQIQQENQGEMQQIVANHEAALAEIQAELEAAKKEKTHEAKVSPSKES